MSDKAASRFAGHVVFVGVICLFIAMAFGLAYVAFGGSTLHLLLKISGFLWLPLIGIGALMRVAHPANPEQGMDTPHDGSGSNT